MDAFLLTDIYGARFMNEDVGGQPFQNQLSRLPKKTAWQVFDANWKNQISSMDTGHGNVNWFVENASLVPNGSYGKNAYIALEDNEDGNTPGFNSYFEGDTAQGVTADTIEELAELMGVDSAKFSATIQRYNELAEAGHDDDFGKRADRMFPVATAPFYAYKLTDTVLLVNMGGLQTDDGFRVLTPKTKSSKAFMRSETPGRTFPGRLSPAVPGNQPWYGNDPWHARRKGTCRTLTVRIPSFITPPKRRGRHIVGLFAALDARRAPTCCRSASH